MRFRISEELQRSLSQAVPWSDDDERLIEVTLDSYSVASAVSDQLGFGRWAHQDSLLFPVLLEIAKALEEPLRRHEAPSPREWSEQLLVPLIERWTVPESITVLRSIGMDRREVGPVRVDRLARELRTMAFESVRDGLAEMIVRWRKRGDFNVDEELERRKAEARRQARRDRASEPRYTPPGRT